MTNLIGCDYTCQRKKNIKKLKDMYETGLTKYYTAYNQYLQHKYDRSSNRAWKRMYAEKTLRPKVENLNNYLNKILTNMKNNIRKSSGIISGQSKKINMSRDEINKKNFTIKKQDEDIERSNVDLISKTRQIGFTAERNTYRRNMIVALLIINILIVAGIIKFYGN
jgi:hypothetical protein|tara:strand:+ start:763 stop:1260 length:498 start_codon:yes stop_codon:yes gene_type:complete